MKKLEQLIRPNIQAFVAKRIPSDSPATGINLRLDTNESPFNTPFNRYPTLLNELKVAISRSRNIRPDCLFPTNGTHEAVDLLLRVFCVPQTDNIISISPTSAIYSNAAAINDIESREVRLSPSFDITAETLLSAADEHTKLIFLCSPNNPTGNLLNRDEILKTADSFSGFVVIDEAYLQFSGTTSIISELNKHPNLIVLNTFSKALASAGIRLGIIYAIPGLIRYLDRISSPYRIGTPTLQEAIAMTHRLYDVDKWTRQILDEREKVMAAFKLLPVCEKVFPSDANFFLAKVKYLERTYQYLLSQGIAVSNCDPQAMCESCLRITIGLTGENNRLLGALRKYNPE